MLSNILSIRLILILFLVVLSIEFIIRGPLRAIDNSYDYTGPYTSAKAWINGQNPYDVSANLKAIQQDDPSVNTITRTAYPPSAFPVISPFTFFDWNTSKLIWMTVSLSLIFISIKLLMDYSNLSINDTNGLLFLLLTIGYAPLHTGVSLGQPAVPAIALAIISLCIMNSGYRYLIPVLLGISIALKPQIGLPFLVFIFIKRQWITAFLTIAVFGSLFFVGSYQLDRVVDDWFGEWVHVINTMKGRDIGIDSSDRYGRLQLHVLLYTFINDTKTVSIMTFLILTVPGLVWLHYVNKNHSSTEWKQPDNINLIAITPLVIISLLVVYHRPYDAILLYIPIAWVLSQLKRHDGYYWILIISFCIFLVPGATILSVINEKGYIPEVLNTSFLWHFIIMPHPTWILIIILSISLMINVNPTHFIREDIVK
jgi:hypothetical protein